MKNIIYLFIFLVLASMIYATGEVECKGTIDETDIPCQLLLPFVNTSVIDCTTLNIKVFNNASTLLYTQTMNTYNGFNCNATFNQTALGSYTFSYSNGDSGSIIVEESNMNFFNMMVYLVFNAILLVFIVFMHKFRDSTASSIVYGWIATAMGVIIGAIVISPNFEVIKGVVFFIDVDYYLATISFILALYTAIASVNLYRIIKPKEESDY